MKHTQHILTVFGIKFDHGLAHRRFHCKAESQNIFIMLSGVTTITMDSKDGKLTVIGDFDSSKILTKLKRRWINADMATFGPYDPKKEAAAVEKKRIKERERERLLEASRGNYCLCGPTTQHQICVCNQEPYHQGCIIS